MQYQKIAKQIIRRFALAFLMQTEPVFSIETIENKKNYILDKETYNEGIDIKGQSTVENQGALSVSTSSKKTPAIKVNEGSTLTLKGADNKWINVTTSEKKSSGLLASGSGTEITANKMDINTKGEGSGGVKAEYDAGIIINESKITSEGEGFSKGVWATGKQSNLIGNYLKIKVKGKEARGVSAQSGASVMINGSVIRGEGEDVNGILASDKNTNVEGNNLTVEVKGQEGHGVRAYREATVNIQNNSVIRTHGAFSHAAMLFDKATLNISDSHLKTTGVDSAILYIDPPPKNNKKRKNRVEITGGSLEASGDLILSDGGVTDVFLNNVFTHSPGSGYLLKVLNSDVAYPGEVNFVINQEKAPKKAKTLRGNIFAALGNKANVTLKKSGLIGWANATHLSVDPDSTWSVTGPSTLKHLKNEGKVEFQSPGATGTSGYTTLSLGSLSGTGMFWMNTDIAGHQGDFIDVTGKAKGDFGVRVNDSGKSPQPEDSLKIIQTGGGDAKFTLANEGGLVDVGTYQYYLIPDDRNQVPDERERVLDDRQRSWSLVSHQPQPSPKSQPESEPNPQTPVSSTLSPTAAVNTEQLQPNIPHPASSSLEPNSNSTLFVNANTLTASEIATGTPVSGEILTREMTPQPEPHSLDEKPVPVAEALTEAIEHKEKQTLEKEIYNEGIEVTGQNAVENKGALSVTTRNQNSPAVTVSDGATLILKGAQDKLVTVTTSGNTSPGLVASGTGTEMTADKIHVTTNGGDSEGLKSEDGATVIVTGSKISGKGDGFSGLLSEGDANLRGNNLTVESNGKDGRGIKASRGAQVNLQDSTVTGTGEHFSGIWAHGEKTHLEGKNITITLNDKNATGVKAYRGATVDMTGSHINGQEDNFSGLSAYQDKTNLTGSNIHIESKGKNGRGVSAGKGAQITIKDGSSITGEGENFVGLFAEKEKTNLKSNKTTIKIKDKNGRGVQVSNGAQVTVEEDTISGDAENFVGLLAEGDKSHLKANKTTIKVKDKNGRGVQASDQAQVVIEESKITGEGEAEDFVGLLAEGNNTKLTGDKVEIEISNQNSRGLKAVDGAEIDIKRSTITGTGNDFLGILAEGDKTNLTGNNVEIQVNAEGGTGVLAQNEAKVVINDSKITGKGENFVGLVAHQENTNLEGKNLTINLNRANGKGVSAFSGAQVDIRKSTIIGAGSDFLGLSSEGEKTNLKGNKLTIESNGKSGTGLKIASGAKMMINDSDITGTGGDFSGVLAYHDINFEGKNLNIKVTGADGKGVNVYKDAKISIEGSSIIGTEENFTGLSAHQDNTQLEVNKTTIESQAKNGKGVTATSGAQVSIEDSSITSEGEKFLGLAAYQENTHLMGNKINFTLKNKNAIAVDVQNGANVIVDNSTMSSEGEHFLGLSAYGENSTLTVNNLTMEAKGKNSKAVEVDKDARVNIKNRSVITTQGDSSPAMQLAQKGRLHISDSHIKTTGENSAIFYAAPGKSQQKSLAEMTGGSLEARGDLILSQGGTMDVVLNDVSVSPPGSGYLLNVLNSDSGYPGEVNLSVFNPIEEKDPTKTLRGNIFAAEGSKADVTLNNSHLIGWAKATNMSIDPTSQWSITGPSTVKQLKNEGKIEFQAPSATSSHPIGTPVYKTLSLASLSGNGMFWMNTDIAGHRGDFLNVTGKAEGDFGVKVTDSGQSPTADDSLKIIQTGGGDAKFTLANEGGVVDVGTYQYYLVADDSNSVPDDSQRVLDDRKRGWSLVSHQSQIKTATKGTEFNSPRPVTASSSETGADEIVTEGMTQLPQPDAPPASTSAPPPLPPTVDKVTEGAIASAQKTLFDDGKSHILRDSLYFQGIEVKNSTTVENLQNQGVLLVSSNHDSKSAVKVSEGSTVTLKGAENKSTTLTTRGTESHGVHASGKGTQVTANKIGITTNDDRSQGIKTDEGATVNIQNSTITGNGENAYGLLAEGENTNLVGNHLKINIHGEEGIGVAGRKAQKVDIEDSAITGTRDDFLGLVAEHTDLEGKNLEIKVKGKNSKGVTTLDSKVNIQGSTISSDGANFIGLVASEGQSKLSVNKTTITTNGQDSKGVKVEKGAEIDIQESTITGHGKNFYGLLASEDQSKLRVNKTAIIANGEDSKGVKAEKGAKVDVKDSTITGHGKNFYALLASADQSKLEVSKTTITANGQNSRGFQVLAGAEGMIEDSTITNTGDNSYGFWADKARLTGKKVTIEVKEGQKGRGVIARDHAHVTLSNDSKITGTGKDFLGLWAYGNQTNFEANNLTIDIKGKNGGGVSAAGGAQVSLKDSRMTGDADAFVGFVASDDQSKLTVNNTTITANGQNSRGLKAVNGAEVTVKDSMMTSTGDNFYGLWASGDKTHLEGNNLTLDLKEGQRGRGVTARNNAHVILNDSKIIGTGPDFFGLSAYGQHATLTVNNLTMNAKGKNSKAVEVDKDAQVNIQNRSVITTEGAFSPAIQLTQKGRLNVSDSAIKTLGKNSATFYVAPGNSEQKSVAEMTGGSLEASGDLILSQGGTMDVVLNQVSVSSPGSGYLLNVLNSNSGQTGEVNLVLNDIKEPGVELEKKQTLRGNIFAAEGSKANVTLNRSELIGWANNATHVSIDPASTWLLTGPSMLKDLHHEGKIQFQSPSAASLNSIGIPGYKSLSLENLSGTGMFWMNTDIAGHQGDFLNVRRKAEGEFGVMVKDSGQSPRADDSLKIIQTGGGNAKFTLANEGGVVDVGTYQYYLVPDDSQQVPDDRNRVLDDRQRGWSLVSHQPQSAEKPQPESEPRSQNPVIPSILPEVDVVTAASGEIVPHGMIDQGSPGQAPTVPEPNQPATVSSIQTVDAGGTPGSVEAMRPEVIHQPQPSEKSQPGLESHRQSSVNESVTETVLASRPLSGGTILPQENQQRPQSGIIASKVSESQPAIAMTPSTVSVIEKPDTSSAVANPQTNLVAQSASNPDEPLGVHSPSPSTTVNAVTQSGAVFSTIERIFDDGESHTLTENGFYKKGIEVKNKTTVHHQGALSVTSSSENSPAVKVIEGSTVTLKGAQDKLITVATGGAHSPGLYASDTGTEITANAIDLTTKGKNSEGVKSEAGAKVGIGLSTIVTTGENAYGLSAVGDKTILNGKNLNINVKGQEGRGVSAKHGANVTVDDSSITGEGNAFRGLFASDKKSNLTGNNLTIVLKGEDAIGVKAQKGASVTIDDSSITNEGESLRSFFVSQEKSNLTGNNININAQDTIGVLALSGASATINNSTISGDGQYSVGLLASGEKSQLSGNNMNIEVNAQDSAGVIAYRGATVKINNGSKITTHGGSSHAALLSEKSTLKITDSDIKTTGTDSAILYGFTPENEGNKSFAEITGGSLDARGDLIASKGGKMDVVLNNVSISSPGSGYALNIMNSDSGHPGEVNLMVNQTKLPGHIYKESGLSRANVMLKGSELSGNVMNATSLLINPQSTWFATGNSVFKSLINEGNIKFQSHIDDTRFNKITIHTLTGPSTGIGMFWMNTDIAGHRGDFLNVTGKAKGNFGVMVSDSGQSPKADDSLKIIQTGGGDAKFTLANRGGVVDVGTYQYYLVPDDRSQVPDDTNRVLDDRERVWSLVSHQPQPSVKPQPESEINPKTRVTPSISPEVGAEIPASGEMVTSGLGSHRQAPVDGSVTDIVVTSRRMPGATVVPETEQQPQPGIVAPAQTNLVAQSALKPNASFGVHSPSPLPTVNTVTESEPIFSTTTLSTITIQGQKNHTFKKKSYHQGIEIKGQSTVGNTGDLSISTSHKNHPAVKVSEGSIVTLKGNDDKLLTLTTTGANSSGLLASDTATEIIANKIDITTQGENSEGVKIVNDARVIINDSNITENGENAYGVWAEGEKTHLMANNVEIELNAQNATGIKAVNGGMVHIVESSVTANDDNSDGLITEGDKSNLRANDLEIEINGHNSTGVKALQGGAGIIENSSIIGHGNAFVGLSAAHEKTHLTGKNLNIEVQNGPKGTGVAAAKGAQINIENGTIIGTGKDFIGLFAADQKTNLEVNQMSIQANAEDSQGVIAENGAKVTVENSSIIGNWENFDGLRSRGENANLTANNTKIELHRENSRGVNIENGAKVDIKNGSQIITRGASSPAIQLAQKGRLNVSDSAIKTFGKNSATFYVAPGNSDKKSVAEMTGGSLEASGDLILSQGGTMDVVLNKVSVSSPGSGYLVNVLNSDSGYPGEVSLSVLNPIGEKDPTKTLRGNIVAAEGSKANVTLNRSELIGWANNATHVSIDPASTWLVTGPSMLKDLHHEGKIQFQSPSATSLNSIGIPGYKSLSLENLSGTGMFWMNTDIAGHQGDFLNVTGKAQGYFGVMVADSGNSPTAEDSLKIIQTGGGDARFTLANEGGVVDVGTYQYYLVPDDRIGVPDDRNRVLDDRQRGWSLVSHQPQPSTKPKPESELNPKTPVTPSTPPEVAVVTAASRETVPHGMIEPPSLSGSYAQVPTVPEPHQGPAVTLSSIETGATGTPVAVAPMTPEVSQPLLPMPESVFISPTAYHVDKSEPVSSKEKTEEKTEPKNLFDDGESHTLAENGVYEKGIEVKNRTTVQSLENQGTLSISSHQNAKSAVKASEASTVTLKGNEDKLITVRATGNHSPGLLASGTGTTITADKMVIITEGQRSEGLKVHDGATAIINNGIITGEGESFNKGLLASGEKSNLKGNNIAITLSGAHGEGVVAERGAEVNIKDSTINVEKDNILNNGMTAFGEKTTLNGNKLTMNVNGINGIGVSVIGGAKAIIEESSLNSKGLNFQGLYASGHGSYLMANKMEMEVDVGNDTNNKIGAGALAKSAGKIDIKHSTLTGKGENFSVLRAEEDNAHVEGNTLTINVAGTKGTGVAAKNTGVVIINDSTINGTEDDFVGLLAQNHSNLKGTNITIDAKGKNGRGVKALINTDVLIEESTIIGQEENFYGLEALGENVHLTANKLDIKIQGESGIGAKTANGAKIIMNDSDITGTADDFSGVLAHEDHTSLTGNNLNIKVNGQNSRGIKVYNGGEVKIHGGRINSQGDRFLGLAAYQEKTNLEGNNLTIESKGKNGTGVKADSGAQVSLRESNINGTGDAFLGLVASGKNTNLTTNNRLKMEIKGQDGIGVKANSGAEVNVNDTTINGIGDDFLGIEAYQDETNLKSNNMTINVNGQNGAAIKIYKEAMANLRGTTIIGTGDYFSGLEAYQEKTNLEGNNLKIQSNGKNSRGIKAHNGAKADIHDSTVTGTGEGFLGLLAFGEKTHLTGHHLMIDINDAKNGRAVTAVNAQVGLNDSSITGTGENFIGIGAYQEKANFTGNKLTVKANGQNSKGITVQDGAHLSMNDSTVTTHEKNSAILYTLYKEDQDEDADNTKRKSVAEIIRGSLEASGNLIVSEGGIMDVLLNNVSVFFRETADVLNVINQGDVNLVANQTNLTGNVFAAPDSKANVTLNKSTLVGWANATNLSVDSGSKWLSTGPSVLKDLKNEGKVQFQSPSVNATGTPGYQTLSLESLSGTGMFWMNTDIAGHQGDFLNVTGKAQGAFGVMVADSGKSPTAEDSLQIIQTGGGDARFTLANQGGVVDVGTYQYHLVPDDNNQVPDDRHRVLDDRARGWSLVSHRSQIKPPTHKGEELTPTPSVVTASASETGAGETQPDAHPESSSVSPTGEKVAEGAIALQKNLFDDGKSHMLSENSLYSDGIEVKNKTTVENTGAVTISSSRDSNSAVKVSEASTVTLKGAEDKRVTLTTRGAESHGLHASGTGTQVTANKIDITTHRDGTQGVKVDKGARVNIDHSTMTGNGEDAYGLWAGGEKTNVVGNHLKIKINAQNGTGVASIAAQKVNIEDSEITGTGDGIFGLVAQYTDLEGKNVDIGVKGKKGKGLRAIQASKVNINDSRMVGEGENFQGIFAHGERTNVTVKKLKIEAKGKNGEGVMALSGAHVNIQDSTLSSDEEAFVGLSVSEDKSNLMVNKTTIKANGQDSKGVKAQKGATVDIQESTINSTGENFDGLLADNAKLTGNKVTIDVKEGHKGRGVVARNHADVTILNDSKISGTGNDFLGLWAYGNQTNLEANHLTLEVAGHNGKGVLAQSEANVIINDSTMTSTGEAFVGLSALEKNTHLTSEKLKINLHAQKGKGIEVKEGANLTANHLNIEAKAKDSTGVIALSEATVSLNNSTINAQESHSLGLLASGDQTHLTGNQLNIQVHAQDSEAVKVEKGAKVDIQQGSTITGNGKNFYGLLATEDQSKLIVNQTTIIANGQYGRGLQVVNGAEGIIEDSTITSTGENFHSLWADKSNLKGKKLTIESKGEKGRGVTARNEARVMINDSKITGNEKDFLGLWADGKNTYLTGKNLEIDVKSKYGKGVSAQNEAHLMIEESTINGDGEAFTGLMASKENTDVAMGHLRINLNGQRGKGVEVTQSAHLKADHLVINTNAQDSAGIMALSDSMVNLNNSKIIGKDSLSLGLLASGDKTNLTGNHINIELNGQNSLGVLVEKGATINMKDSTMTTLGVLSHAARLSKKGTLNVTDSRITTLGENSAILYVDSDDPKQKSAAEITGGFLEASGDLMLSKGAALDVILNNVAISSPGSGYALNVLNSDSGHPGHVNLVVNETTLPGRIFTAKGSKAQVRLKRSELIGEVDATNLSVDADSLWTLTGNSVLKELIHGGKIAFKPHRDMSFNKTKAIDYSTLYLDTLSGEGGTFWMNTDIAGHRGDFLHVRGEANGHFGVMVTDSGQSPEPEDSLKIIQTGGGEAEFTLTNPGQVVDVGTYQYHLVPDNHKRSWSLVSHQTQTSEKPQPESESPPKASVIPSATETVAASRPISGDTLLPQETEHSVQPGIGSPKATEPKPEVPVTPSVPEEKETVLTPVSGEAVASAVTDETQTRKLAPKAPELKPEEPVTPSVPEEKGAVLTPVSGGETVAPAVTDETQTRQLAPKAPELKPEEPVAPSVPEEKGAVLTPVSGETVTSEVTQTPAISAPEASEPKSSEVPVAPSVEKEGEKKAAPNRLRSSATNVSRTNRGVPDIPSITPSTAAVLSMSTVGPLIYHSEMAQIQERMSETRQAKTEDTVWVKVMNQRHNISQKAGDGYWLRLNGLSVGADCTIRLGRGYTTRGVFFTHSDDKLNFRGKAIGGGNVSSWSAGTYAAYYHDSGFWLDGILKANRFSQEIRGKMTGGWDAFGDFSTLALGASIRGGKDMVAGEMTFTPYLSLSGLRTTRSSLSLSNGMKGDIFAQRSVLGKVGLRALYQTRIKEVSVTPWIDVGVEREFIKNNRVRINQRDSFDNDLSGITGAYSLGLSANISQTWNISATAGYKKGKHVESPWSTSLGMSWKF